MITYQELLQAGDGDGSRIEFVLRAINSHKGSKQYQEAVIAQEYMEKRNRTITEYQKLLYNISGQAVPDNYSANYKLASGFFQRFVIQQNQFLLGNGVSWANGAGDKLGEEFDYQLQDAGEKALVGGVSFGFWNYDHLEVFSILEMVPLYDELTGGLAAAIRFWQIDGAKPLRATLYEIDGLTEYQWIEGKGEVLREKTRYITTAVSSPADGVTILDGRNYDGFPIVPMYANKYRISELTGIREQIDAYDLIKSGFCNTIDEASMVYWAIQNAGGMDDVDLVKFVERMKTLHAGLVEDSEAKAEAHTIEAPFEGREKLLERLENDLYRDYMALDVSKIASGAATATEIKAAYEPLNAKADMYEYCVTQFVRGILDIAGIDDSPTYTRSMIVNTAENVQMLLQCSTYLPGEYLTRKILDLLGDGDKAEEVLRKLDAEDMERYGGQGTRADGGNADQTGTENPGGVQEGE